MDFQDQNSISTNKHRDINKQMSLAANIIAIDAFTFVGGAPNPSFCPEKRHR